MSELIDLDLIKLRATVRGWVFESNDPDTALVKCGYGGWIVFCAGKPPWRECDKRIEATLTAPRWTLARLLSEPPEGWRNVGREVEFYDPCIAGYLLWGGQEATGSWDVKVQVAVFQANGRSAVYANPTVIPDCGPEGLAHLAERHKAAAELALIIAEIQP